MTTILLVEDDVHLMEGIREILELDNTYQVVTANNGLDGLELLNNLAVPPDLIVSDIMMPKMDGYQFFEAVRAKPAWLTIPFIFLTAKGEKADIRLGKSLGADDYVTKPFSAEDLLVAVESKLKSMERIRSAFSGQISDMKRRILTILNHEFRTPLTYVVAYADMLSRDVDKMELDELREYLKGVNSGADRLRRLVENFIFLVELETGEVASTFTWRKRPIKNFDKIVSLASRPEQSVLESMNQTLKVDISPNHHPILGDEEYLGIALARLIDNASKFSEKGATIELLLYGDTQGQMTFAVRDYGRGIPTEELDRIFEPFYQINRQKYEDQGAGSGLAIVQGVANVHEAEIEVDSSVGEGSTFYLHFPPLK